MPAAIDRITASHEIMCGKSVVRGTRLTELLLRKMSEGATAADLLRMYPQLEMADVEAALHFAGQSNPNEQLGCPAT